MSHLRTTSDKLDTSLFFCYNMKLQAKNYLHICVNHWEHLSGSNHCLYPINCAFLSYLGISGAISGHFELSVNFFSLYTIFLLTSIRGLQMAE